MYNKILSVDYGFGKKTINGVQLKLSSSTSQARAFNIAIKLASLDWTDCVIDQIENLLDSHLIEIAEANDKGVKQIVSYKKYGGERIREASFYCLSQKRAEELLKLQNKDATIISVEEKLFDKNNYKSDDKSSIISNPF